jgi:excisionase family DNA binding protein
MLLNLPREMNGRETAEHVRELDAIPVEDAPYYLKVPEAAALLRVNPDSVYRLIHQGRLPVIRIGRLMRIDRRDLNGLKFT